MGRSYRYTDVRREAVDFLIAWDIVSDHERISERTPVRGVVLEDPVAPIHAAWARFPPSI